MRGISLSFQGLLGFRGSAGLMVQLPNSHRSCMPVTVILNASAFVAFIVVASSCFVEAALAMAKTNSGMDGRASFTPFGFPAD